MSLAWMSKETLGQRLVQTVAKRLNTDTTDGTEQIKWLEPETFPSDKPTFAVHKEEGAIEAKIHTDVPGE